MQMYTNKTNEKKNKHFFFPWYCDYAERQPFDEIKHRHTLKEVGDVAEGRYDWKIERGKCFLSYTKKLFLPMFITLSDGFHFGIKKTTQF